jgi:biopolymer transport protein ExbB
MNYLENMIKVINNGGFMTYPLLLMGIISLALVLEKITLYRKMIKLPHELLALIETYNFNWSEFEKKLAQLPEKNCYRRFFGLIAENKKNAIWWLESRAGDEAKLIEKKLNSGLWILETIITASPLLGLLGTIIGMMSSFKIMGEDNLLNPAGVTGGVAEALIVTALGLFIAILSLFAFNYFSRRQDEVLDELERLGTRIIDHIKLDRNEN